MKSRLPTFIARSSLFVFAALFTWGAQAAPDIFSSKLPIEFFLKAKEGSFRELFTKRAIPNKPNPPEIEDFKIGGELIYTSHDGKPVVIPVSIQLRGNTSQAEDQCPFPKLKLKIKAENSKGTLFENQKELGIATHCNSAEGASPKYGRVWGGKSPHREALIYQMLEALQIPSFQARLAYGTYFENTGEVLATRAQAFFLEDMSAFEKRVGGREIRGTDIKPEMRKTGPKAPPYIFNSATESPGMDLLNVTKIFFFQNLIRNNDFHLRLDAQDPARALWNVKAVELSPTKWMVFPYDFDLSGIVRDSDNNRKTANLKERFHVSLRAQAAAEFEHHKNRLYEIAGHLKSEDPDGYRIFRARLDQFYSELHDLKN